MGSHLVLVARDEEVLVIVMQHSRFVLFETDRVLFSSPGVAAIGGTEGDELLAVLVVFIDLSEPVAEYKQAVLRVVHDARPDVDDGMCEGVVSQRLGKMFPSASGIVAAENTVIVYRDDIAIAGRADGVEVHLVPEWRLVSGVKFLQ